MPRPNPAYMVMKKMLIKTSADDPPFEAYAPLAGSPYPTLAAAVKHAKELAIETQQSLLIAAAYRTVECRPVAFCEPVLPETRKPKSIRKKKDDVTENTEHNDAGAPADVSASPEPADRPADKATGGAKETNNG